MMIELDKCLLPNGTPERMLVSRGPLPVDIAGICAQLTVTSLPPPVPETRDTCFSSGEVLSPKIAAVGRIKIELEQFVQPGTNVKSLHDTGFEDLVFDLARNRSFSDLSTAPSTPHAGFWPVPPGLEPVAADPFSLLPDTVARKLSLFERGEQSPPPIPRTVAISPVLPQSASDHMHSQAALFSAEVVVEDMPLQLRPILSETFSESGDSLLSATSAKGKKGKRKQVRASTVELPQTSEDLIPSRGSKNHAYNQCRPCKKFSTPEGCPDGALCNFCHFPHASSNGVIESSLTEPKIIGCLKGRKANCVQCKHCDFADPWYVPIPEGLIWS